MAEVLGAVAASAQLVQLSAQILSSGYAFLSKAAKAPSEIRQLLTEAAALDCVLDRLQNIPRPSTPTTDDPLVTLHKSGIFRECNDLLVSVQKALDSFVEIDRQRVANLAKRIAWPLREKEVTDALQRLSRLRGIISTAIEASSARALSRVESTQAKLVGIVTELRTDLSSQKDVANVKDVLAWLSSSSAEERDKTLQRNLAVRLPGSGKWLLDSNVYASWKNDPGHCLMWINGLPGAGKTVLFSAVVQDLQTQSTVKLSGDVTLYHFCTPDSGTYTETPTVQFLKDISVQFAVSSEACFQIALQTWKSKAGSPLDLSGYLTLLLSFVAKFNRIYLLVDALDETNWRDSRETQAFLETLTRLSNERPPSKSPEDSDPNTGTWKILLSSRMHTLISHWLGKWCRGPAQVLSLDAHAKPDLDHFVSAELSRRLKVGSLRLRNNALEREIVAEITRHAGTFLHATLQLDSVTNTRSDKEVKAALRNLTSGLDLTYEQILSTAAQRYPKRVEEMKEILELLVLVGTMPCAAIAEQLSIELGDTCLDRDNIVTDPEDLITPLSQLVYITRSDHDGRLYARLSHFTVAEFLTSGAKKTKGSASQFHVNHVAAHTRMLSKYLQYLAFSDFDNISPVAAIQKYDLLSHAVLSWPHHLRSSRIWVRSPSHFKERVLPYLDWFTSRDAGNPRFNFWRTIHSMFTRPLGDSYLWHPLAFSIAQGLGCLVDILLPRFTNGDLDTRFERGHTYLTIAASENQLDLAKHLLDTGANVDTPTANQGLTALHIAAERGFEAMTTLLLSAGASPQARSNSGSTPFYRAARGGSVPILRQLHAAGSEVDALTWDEWTPLMEAVEHGNDEAIELLLRWGADPTRMSKCGTTPLGLTTLSRGLEPVIKAAIDRWNSREGEHPNQGPSTSSEAQDARPV